VISPRGQWSEGHSSFTDIRQRNRKQKFKKSATISRHPDLINCRLEGSGGGKPRDIMNYDSEMCQISQSSATVMSTLSGPEQVKVNNEKGTDFVHLTLRIPQIKSIET